MTYEEKCTSFTKEYVDRFKDAFTINQTPIILEVAKYSVDDKEKSIKFAEELHVWAKQFPDRMKCVLGRELFDKLMTL